jgi:molybdenum cofactor synthesis domain-containing protein
MRPFTGTLSFDDALGIVKQAARPLTRTETLDLSALDGRVLAQTIVADQDVPAFERAAMDGYAVVAADTTGATASVPVSLQLVGRVDAGHPRAVQVGAGTCVQVATGAPLPPGADAVVMVEHTRRDGDHILVDKPATPRQHVGARGADIRSGETVIAAGTPLTPARIGAVAAIGRVQATVLAKPRVAIMCTGDEVVSPGVPLQGGQVYNVNRYTLEALVTRHGGQPVIVPTTGDSLSALNTSLALARECDLIVSSGGSSVGEHDLVIDALRQHGDVLFHGVAIKPGKPTVFGRVYQAFWLGLSGYPASCLSNAYIFLVPLLRQMAGLPEWRPRRLVLPLARRITSPRGRVQFYQVRVEGNRIVPAFKASGDITSMAHADGYVTVPVDDEVVEAGTVMDVTLYD